MVAERQQLVEDLAGLTARLGISLAAAESLTCGAIASALGAGPEASSWFAGGVVAYQEQVKARLLKVTDDRVVTAQCAEQMATGVRTLLHADVALSATGVGGPEPSEGEPPGTVFLGIATEEGAVSRRLQLTGQPEEVLAQTVDHGLQLLLDVLRRRERAESEGSTG